MLENASDNLDDVFVAECDLSYYDDRDDDDRKAVFILIKRTTRPTKAQWDRYEKQKEKYDTWFAENREKLIQMEEEKKEQEVQKTLQQKKQAVEQTEREIARLQRALKKAQKELIK
jgi:hypothetical protein